MFNRKENFIIIDIGSIFLPQLSITERKTNYCHICIMCTLFAQYIQRQGRMKHVSIIDFVKCLLNASVWLQHRHFIELPINCPRASSYYYTSLKDCKPWLADLTVSNHHVHWTALWPPLSGRSRSRVRVTPRMHGRPACWLTSLFVTLSLHVQIARQINKKHGGQTTTWISWLH